MAMTNRSLSRRSVLEAAVAATGTVALAGCGGDGGAAEDDGDATPTDADTTTPTNAGTPTLTPIPLKADFRFEYNPDPGTVEVTHIGGDSIPADELYIRGEGFADAAGADMTAAGQWAGPASARLEGRPAVGSGDSVTVGAAGDYVLRVFWEDEERDIVSQLVADRGPRA